MRIGVDARSLMDRPTGIGRYTQQLARRLLEDGHDLTLYAFGGRRPSPLLEELAAEPGVRLVRHALPMRALRQLWRRTRAPALESFVGDVDLAVASETTMPVTSAPILAVVYDALWDPHPEWFTRYARVAGRENLADVAARADAAVVISEASARAAAALHPELAGRLHVVAPIADAPVAPAAPRDERTVLFVGTREPRKGLDVVARALLRSRGAAARARLVVAGGRGWGDGGRGALSLLEAGGRADVLGFVDDRRVAELRAGCALAVVSALDEGFGLPLLEAMAAGCPVLASDIAVFREVAGEACARAAPGDVEAWADALEALLGDGARRDALTRAALARARAFSAEAQGAGVAAAVAAAVARGRRARREAVDAA